MVAGFDSDWKSIVAGVCDEDAGYWIEWKLKTRVTDPKTLGKEDGFDGIMRLK